LVNAKIIILFLTRLAGLRGALQESTGHIAALIAFDAKFRVFFSGDIFIDHAG